MRSRKAVESKSRRRTCTCEDAHKRESESLQFRANLQASHNAKRKEIRCIQMQVARRLHNYL